MSQYIGQTITMIVNTTPQVSDELAAGVYSALCTETAVYLRQGDANVVVFDNDMMLTANRDITFVVSDDTCNRIAAKAASVNEGILRITRIDAV